MSGGTACRCPGRNRQRWYVLTRNANRSAFNGYRFTPSAYSEITCATCGAVWRTKADYVQSLPDTPPPKEVQKL